MRVTDFMHEMRGTSAVLGRSTGVAVTFSGEVAYTDGRTINLPSLAMDKTLTPHQVMVMRGYVDHEAGHLRHSDMKRIRDFYARLGNQDPPNKELKQVHNCVEDVWMEGEVMLDYAGSYKNLKATNEMVIGRAVAARKGMRSFLKTSNPDDLSDVLDAKMLKELKSSPEAMAQTKLEVAKDLDEPSSTNIGLALKAFNTNYQSPLMEEYREFLKDDLPTKVAEMGPTWSSMANDCEGTEECITLAKSIYELLEDEDKMEGTSPEDFDGEAGEGMEEGDLPADFDPDKEGDGEGEGKAKGKDKGEGEGDSERRILPKDYMPDLEEALTSEAHDGAGGIGGMDGPLVGGYRVLTTKSDIVYSLKGVKKGGYSHIWDLLQSGDSSQYVETKQGLKSNINVMQAKLRRSLLAKAKRDWDYGKERGRLDSKRLVSIVASRATNVYKTRTDRLDQDTAVTFLVDLSGSMGGQKAEVAKECVIAMAECLEGTQIAYKIEGFCNKGMPDGYGYSSKGMYHRYERLDTVVFKDYDTRLTSCRAGLGNLPETVGGNNSDYDFIANSLAELKKRPEKRKVLFVLSDGHPACHSDASGEEIIRHCKDAIKRADRDGVECIGIGICDSSVKKIYNKNVVVNNVNELSSKVFNTLSKLLVG